MGRHGTHPSAVLSSPPRRSKSTTPSSDDQQIVVVLSLLARLARKRNGCHGSVCGDESTGRGGREGAEVEEGGREGGAADEVRCRTRPEDGQGRQFEGTRGRKSGKCACTTDYDGSSGRGKIDIPFPSLASTFLNFSFSSAEVQTPL
jgi:hypothetical protein